MKNQQGNYLESRHIREHNMSPLKTIAKKWLSKTSGISNTQGLFLKYLVDMYGKKNISVLDVGTGDGWCLLSYNTSKIKEKIYMDIDDLYQKSIEKKGGKFLLEFIHKTSLKDESIDIIIMNHVLEHIPNTGETLKEIKRILKKGGLIVVRVPDIKKVKFQFFDDYTHIKPFTKKSLQQCFKAYNFKIETSQNFHYEHFMLAHFLMAKPMKWLFKRGKEALLIARK